MDVVITPQQAEEVVEAVLYRLGVSVTFEGEEVRIEGSISDAITVITHIAMAATTLPHQERFVIRFLGEEAEFSMRSASRRGGTPSQGVQVIRKVVVRDE